VVSFVFALSLPLYLAARHDVGWDNAFVAIDSLSGVYAPYIGAILAFYFASRTDGRRGQRSRRQPFLLAFATSLAWNLLIIGAMVAVLTHLRGIEEATKDISTIGSKMSWLVAPAVGYFFAESCKPDGLSK
jgi:hypothetical protein